MLEIDPQRSAALLEGRAAFYRREPRRANPYPEEPLRRKAWSDGWVGAWKEWKRIRKRYRRLGTYAVWPYPRPDKWLPGPEPARSAGLGA